MSRVLLERERDIERARARAKGGAERAEELFSFLVRGRRWRISPTRLLTPKKTKSSLVALWLSVPLFVAQTSLWRREKRLKRTPE